MQASSRQPDLRGRTALVTGASRGLGRAIAEGLWSRGASLWLAARCEPELARLADELRTSARPGQAVWFTRCDLAEPDAPVQLIASVRQEWAKLDVLVNNAAIVGPIGKSWENDWAAWEATVRINLLVPVQLCRAVVPWMLATGTAGRIINLSGGGATGPRPFFSAYATAKTGIVRFSEVLAAELTDTPITVNCIAPGAMNTAMAEAVRRAGPSAAGSKEFDQAQAMTQGKTGVGPERAVDLVAFLASKESQGISGRLIAALWDNWAELPERVGELAASDIYTLRRIVAKDRGKDWDK